MKLIPVEPVIRQLNAMQQLKEAEKWQDLSESLDQLIASLQFWQQVFPLSDSCTPIRLKPKKARSTKRRRRRRG